MAEPARQERRRLAAILAADVVGYAGLIATDEAGTLARLRALFREVVQPLVARHGGRIFRLLGDALLAEFSSAVEALRGAIILQDAILARAAADPDRKRIVLRVGIALGDVVVEGGDLYGDGVNIAARLEALAEPGGILVSGAIAEQVRGRLACGFDDLGPRTLKNVPWPVHVFRIRPEATAPRGRPDLPLPDRPSLAVLPFANPGGDPEQEYLADGLVEDVIAALSRIRWLFVIARNSSFAFRDQPKDVRRIGRELGVRYLLEGSVRRAGARLRIAGQLIEAETGAHLWAERFEGELGDLFTLQDEVAASVVGAIEPALALAEQLRATRKPPQDLDALESYHRGLWHFHRPAAEDNARAQAYFRHAVELSPGFAAAQAGLALALLYEAWLHHPAARAELTPLAVDHARRAVVLDPLDATAHRALSVGLKMLGRPAESLAEAEAALRLSPGSAWAHAAVGAVHTFDGRPAEAIAPLRRALRLSPFDLQRWNWLKNLAFAHYFAGDYPAAVEAARELCRLHPEYRFGATLLAAALAQAGELPQARGIAAEVTAIRGEANLVASMTLRIAELREEDHQHLLEGWRKAGFPV